MGEEGNLRRYIITPAIGIAICIALLATSCGGGGNNGPQPTPVPPQFPDRGGGETSTPPAAAKTGRIFFDSASGERCCVAIDPTEIPGGGILVLDDLPAGPATVIVSYFAVDFAPAVPGVTLTCATVPASLGFPCDPTQVASPSYESTPQNVNIVPNSQADTGQLMINAKPFVVDFAPGDGEVIQTPVQFTFTLGDAVTGVAADSVALELTVEIPEEGGGFRKLTKRLPVTLTPCDDSTDDTCSPDGVLDLVGFHASSEPAELLAGPVDVRILAINLAEPPQDLDFSYAFDVIDELTGQAEGSSVEEIAAEAGAAQDAGAAEEEIPADAVDGGDGVSGLANVVDEAVVADCTEEPCEAQRPPTGSSLGFSPVWPPGHAEQSRRAAEEGGG